MKMLMLAVATMFAVSAMVDTPQWLDDTDQTEFVQSQDHSEVVVAQTPLIMHLVSSAKAQDTIGNISVPEPQPLPAKGDFMGWLYWIIPLVLFAIEIITRFIPATSNWTPLTILYNLLSKIKENNAGNGETLKLKRVRE